MKLQTQVTELTDKVSNLSVQVDEQEQYFRRNCLLIHGVEENENEDSDTLSINIFNEHLGVDIQPSDIDQTHLIGNKTVFWGFYLIYFRVIILGHNRVFEGKNLAMLFVHFLRNFNKRECAFKKYFLTFFNFLNHLKNYLNVSLMFLNY